MQLTAPSQVIERQLSKLANNILILNHENDTLHTQLKQNGLDVCTLHFDFQHHLNIPNDPTCTFGVQLTRHVPEQFNQIIVFYPKSKAFAQYLLHLAAFYLKPNGILWVVGDNRSGVKQLSKQIPDFFEPCRKLDQARHCLLFETSKQKSCTRFEMEDWFTEMMVQTPQGALSIASLPGVFSQKKLDQGTQLMLENLPKLKGRVLDFGCGYGVIACAVAKQYPHCDIEAVDINAMALESCKRTLSLNQCHGKVYPSNGLNQVDGLFDAIVSNPPFHDGMQHDLRVTKQFILDSTRCLKKNGQWQIVVNTHLKYTDIIQQAFKQSTIKAQTTQFKIFHSA
jgi:16S rRNA (guanine1207-N2)-methyltransferase